MNPLVPAAAGGMAVSGKIRREAAVALTEAAAVGHIERAFAVRYRAADEATVAQVDNVFQSTVAQEVFHVALILDAVVGEYPVTEYAASEAKLKLVAAFPLLIAHAVKP